jgi:L-ascorbate 6-phosphate lactonase
MSTTGSIDEIKPTGIPAKVRNAAVDEGTIALWYIGGAGYLIRAGDTTIVVDPFLGPSNPPDWMRGVPPPFAPEEIDDLGVVNAMLMTHEHLDHADPVALAAFKEHPEIPLYGTGSAIEVALDAEIPENRLHILSHGDAVTIGDLKISAVAVNDPTAKECNGYVLQHGETSLLLCGDSHYFDGFAALGEAWEFDAVAVTVGANPPGQSIYMGESDAGRIARDTRTKKLIHQHHDLWQALAIDPARVGIAVSWYAPEAEFEGVVFGERIDVTHR